MMIIMILMMALMMIIDNATLDVLCKLPTLPCQNDDDDDGDDDAGISSRLL